MHNSGWIDCCLFFSHTIHHPPYIARAFFPPLLFTCGVLDRHFLRIILHRKTLQATAKIAGFIATLGVLPCITPCPKRKGMNPWNKILSSESSPSSRCLKDHFWLADPPAHSLTNHDDVFAITDNGRYKNERERSDRLVGARVPQKPTTASRGVLT